MKNIIILLALLLFFPSVLVADDLEDLRIQYSNSVNSDFLYTVTLEECMSLVGASAGGWKICIDADTKRHDKRLNDIYQELMGNEDKNVRVQLMEIQRAWIKYRDLKCNWMYISGASGMGTYQCLRDETKKRADELFLLSD